MSAENHANAAMVDKAALFDQFEGDLELIRDIALLFLDACPRRLSAIRDAIALGDRQALQAAAHSVRGSASNFGAAAVVAAALRLEVIAHTDDLSDAVEACRALERAIACLQPELVALCSAVPKEVH
jgi:HPt (histidine-containing phosphotransfer) domain-containing protein